MAQKLLFEVTGMTCDNCVRHVTEAAKSVRGVSDARWTCGEIGGGRGRLRPQAGRRGDRRGRVRGEGTRLTGAQGTMTTETKTQERTPASKKQQTITLDISGMTCASCVRRVERALSKVQGVESANVNFASETALVTADASVPDGAADSGGREGGVRREAAVARRRDRRERAATRGGRWRSSCSVRCCRAGRRDPAMAMDIAGLSIDGNDAAARAGSCWRWRRPSRSCSAGDTTGAASRRCGT